MNIRPFLPCLAVLGLADSASAIKIEIRYDYDTNGFFDQPGAKEAMRSVADYFEGLIHDSLSAIDHTQWPAGNTWTASFEHPAMENVDATIENLNVPADTLIIFAGGRPLGTPAGRGGYGGYSYWYNQVGWATLIETRGQAGASAATPTDFGPWGGFVTFDTEETWNFSLTTPVNNTTPFVTIALHELGHALGIGTAPSWHAKISSNVFTGFHASQAYGSAVPVQSEGGHWLDDEQCALPDGYDPEEPKNVLSKAFGSFGAPHGFAQIAVMDPSTCLAGAFHKVMTDLDIAALRDIGWQIEPPLGWIGAQVNPVAGPLSFSWASTSGTTYRVQQSTSLAAGSWVDIHSIAGNGSILDYEAPAPGGTQAFFRLNTNPVAPAAMSVSPPEPSGVTSRPPVAAEGCQCGHSWACD